MPRFIARHSFFSACADKVIEFHLILHFALEFKLKMRGTVRFCDVIYRRFPGGGNPYRLSEKECSWINFHIENKYENLGNTEYLNFIPFFLPFEQQKLLITKVKRVKTDAERQTAVPENVMTWAIAQACSWTWHICGSRCVLKACLCRVCAVLYQRTPMR